MVELAEHPLVNAVRRYAENAKDVHAKEDLPPGIDRYRRDLLRAIKETETAAATLADATARTPIAKVRRLEMPEQMARLLTTQIALWQSLGYVPEASAYTNDVREALVNVIHEIGEVVELVAFKVDEGLSAELERRLASIPQHYERTENWRDVIDAL